MAVTIVFAEEEVTKAASAASSYSLSWKDMAGPMAGSTPCNTPSKTGMMASTTRRGVCMVEVQMAEESPKSTANAGKHRHTQLPPLDYLI